MNPIGTVIKQLREQKGLTQRELAAAVGVTDQAVSNWETGKNEPRLTLGQTDRLLSALSCTLEELLKS